MNRYPFENLSAEAFEQLVISVCKKILGIGCSTFSKGPDGAKDSWFVGSAEHYPTYPSKASPWSEKTCIQAKHTSLSNASCSDNDFFLKSHEHPLEGNGTITSRNAEASF